MALRNFVVGFLVSLLLVNCNSSSQNKAPFGKGKVLGTNKNEKLEEASGLVASEKNPGYLWTLNDSGNPAEIFLINDRGETKEVFTLANIKNRDFEDIALGPGPEKGISYLYVADIGDNLAQFPYKLIYRLPEPSRKDSKTIVQFDTLVVKVSDGVRDSETLMSDPQSGNLYLVSKREQTVRLYEIQNKVTRDTLVAEKIETLPYTQIVAGDISPDGREVLMKNYDSIYYWKKAGDESIVELLRKPAIRLPYDREPQGEAIAFARDGSGYFTLGENAKGERSKLFFYKRKD